MCNETGSQTVIIVGSTNPAKVEAVRLAVRQIRMNERLTGHGHILQDVTVESVQGVSVHSGVSSQPRSDEETIQGAVNRAHDLHVQFPDAVCIGLEGGTTETRYGMMICNWGCLVEPGGRRYVSGGLRMPLPASIADGIRQGKELGELMDQYTNRAGVSKKEGAIGILSQGLIDRSHMFRDTVLLLFGQAIHDNFSNRGCSKRGASE
jgi:inosine/xanthosine triphosphatase